jgi:hypothetical protein
MMLTHAQIMPRTAAGGIIPVATGFAWAENLACVRSNSSASLYATENIRGELWKVDWSAANGYSQRLLPLSANFSLLAGLASDGGRVFALGNRDASRGCDLFEVMPNGGFQVLSTLPRRCLGDGLAVRRASGGNLIFYSANEGNFVPDEGRVYRIDGASGQVTVAPPNGFSTDGVFLDTNGRLLVSEVASPRHSIRVYNVSSPLPTLRSTLHPTGVHAIDDFSIRRNALYGADTLAGCAVVFDVSGAIAAPPATRLACGLRAPTSARFGCVPDVAHGFSAHLLFVSEGGGLRKSDRDRRVVALAVNTTSSTQQSDFWNVEQRHEP